MALSLSQAGIDTTLISDNSVFAIMSRVNKVILGTHAVLANGGLVAMSGSHVVAASAKHHSTPVVVLTELYKMSSEFPFDVDGYNLLQNADTVFGFENGNMIEKIDIINPTFDCVGPELVNLFITNIGAHPPSYVSRLIYEDSREH
ncbi:UNVERIFIED_CONTAM: GCD complex subunit gcd7 [Siphonaria sp. JEL0065]|nr:GCD complex subunit gcd7 [Siphonaria sp. JEL0065]